MPWRGERANRGPYAITFPGITASPTEPELLAALTNAGWLLEQNVAHVLADEDCHPRLGWAFQDVDEPNKSRELDVFGYRQVLRDDDAQVIVSATFLVECKQSTLPYVAVGQTLPTWQFKQPAQHKLAVEKLRFSIPDSESYQLNQHGKCLDLRTSQAIR